MKSPVPTSNVADALPTKVNATQLPNAICIGGQRCGSTWLGQALASHPDVFAAPDEPSIFNRVIRTEGLHSACRFFEAAGNQKIRFEKTPTYSAMYPEEIEFVKKLLPKLKIIFIVRNPVDRVWSSITRAWTYKYLGNQRPVPNNIFSLSAAVEQGLTCRLTDYASTFESWNRCFGSSQLLVLSYDDLQQPDEFLGRISNFLDIDPCGFAQATVMRRANVSSKTHSQIPEWLAAHLASRWLPMLYRFQSMSDVNIQSWIDELEVLQEKRSLLLSNLPRIYRAIHVWPYATLTRLKRRARRRQLSNVLSETRI